MDRRQPQPRWQLRPGNRVDATSGVATDLRRCEFGIPERHEAKRDQATAGIAAPFLDHPVVVGLHTELRELFVLALGE